MGSLTFFRGSNFSRGWGFPGVGQGVPLVISIERVIFRGGGGGLDPLSYRTSLTRFVNTSSPTDDSVTVDATSVGAGVLCGSDLFLVIGIRYGSKPFVTLIVFLFEKFKG